MTRFSESEISDSESDSPVQYCAVRYELFKNEVAYVDLPKKKNKSIPNKLKKKKLNKALLGRMLIKIMCPEPDVSWTNVTVSFRLKNNLNNLDSVVSTSAFIDLGLHRLSKHRKRLPVLMQVHCSIVLVSHISLDQGLVALNPSLLYV